MRFAFLDSRFFHNLMLVFLGVWVCAHVPGLTYGAFNIPLHMTYVGDEQVSVNSALRVLNEKSILAFRNREMQYYGPMFVAIDTPGVAFDFVWKYVTGVVSSPEEYKRYIVWDWGGIIRAVRVTAILSMLFGLVVVYKLANTATLNPSRNRYVPYLVTGLMAVNYFYFEYSHFSIHWAYVIPCLFLAWYTLVRIQETEGKLVWCWFVHGAAVVVSFGVSYFSLIFLSMWWPTLWGMWREKNRALFVRWISAMIVTGIACALIVWWHPYAFLRYLSFVGIGADMHHLGDTQNPFVMTNPSWIPYIWQIVINNLGLVAVFILLILVLWRRTHLWRSAVLWTILWPGIMNYFLFAPAEHYEGRYALPTIVALVIASGYLLSVYLAHTELHTRLVSIMLVTFLAWYTGFHLVHDTLWMHIFAQGPIEQEAVQTVLELQKTGAPVLIVNSYIFGYPHTKDSYHAFAEHRKFGDIPLYREIYAHPLPSGRPILDARYMFLKDFDANPRVLNEYKHAVLLFRPRSTDWNQFSYFDEDIVSNWYYRELSPTYIVIK